MVTWAAAPRYWTYSARYLVFRFTLFKRGRTSYSASAMEHRFSMIVGTAGHIDHGKTALVHALTGVQTDRLQDEKKRGITIALGYAYTPLPNGDILGFVDVPGHENLVHTMVSGATGIDFAMLTVAADD